MLATKWSYAKARVLLPLPPWCHDSLTRPSAKQLFSHPRQFNLQSTYAAAQADKSPALTENGPLSAYVHLPFCKRKCFYCDFPVTAVGRNTAASHVQQQMQEYVDVICMEISSTQRLNERPLQTVFFGGGTPSLVPPELVERVLSSLQHRLGLSPRAEISLEADPGTFDQQRLRQYLQLGVSRVSIGVQAFQQDLLEACGRSHTLAEVYAAIEAVHAVSPPTWSLDLISGLPQLTRDKWRHSLQEAVKAGPSHVSVYDLQVEEGTPFARWYNQGQSPLPKDDDAAAMYAEASSVLGQAGYEHYEVSNYARSGHRCAHNQAYWLGKQYYAFGVGAASYLQGRRFSRPAKMKEYVAWAQQLQQQAQGQADGAGQGATRGEGCVPGSHLPPESKEDQLLDTIMLRLRMADGLDLGQLSSSYGVEVADRVRAALHKHKATGCVQELSTPSGGAQVRLSDPQGFLLSNDIISDVFAEFDMK